MTDDALIEILLRENLPPSPRVMDVCNAISERHPNRVQAFLYYGSSLRDMDNPDKMLDFYVLVDSYRKTHKNPVRALLNAVIPPAVYYYEMTDAEGVLSTCKYSILSLSAFERKCTNKALLSQIWGRFSQPSALLMPISDRVKNRIMYARMESVRHMAHVTAPLINTPVTSTQFWARGYRESYRTELRPEASDTRSEEIVDRYKDRYTELLATLYSQSEKDSLFHLPNTGKRHRFWCKAKWFLRRLLGKPCAAIRVINSAATFDGGLDYVLRKLQNHSGVTIEPTGFQKRHPVISAPILGWKLWRKGAFR